MKAKKLFPAMSFKRLWNKIKELESKVGSDNNDEQNDNKIDKSWTLIGGLGNKQSLVIPNDANEILVNVGYFEDVEFLKIIPLQLFSSESVIVMIGSYFYDSSNHCYINADISRTSFKIRNYRINGSDKNYFGNLYYR